MIKSAELRIGNKVLYKPWDNPTRKEEIVTISWVSGDSAGYMEQHEASYPHSQNEYSPIALTPEILEKCGFERDAGGWRVKVSEHLFLYWGEMERIVRMCFLGGEFSYPIYLKKPVYHFQYFHQLQNLYFALTGEELTITL